ncbi:hypothetical protein, partial [Streptomyces sp. NPDC002537]
SNTSLNGTGASCVAETDPVTRSVVTLKELTDEGCPGDFIAGNSISGIQERVALRQDGCHAPVGGAHS